MSHAGREVGRRDVGEEGGSMRGIRMNHGTIRMNHGAFPHRPKCFTLLQHRRHGKHVANAVGRR